MRFFRLLTHSLLKNRTLIVIPAKAGIQKNKLDSPGSSPGQAWSSPE